MPKTPYHQPLHSFPDLFEKALRRTIDAGRLVIEWDTERELRRERLKFHKYFNSLQWFQPGTELAEMSKRIEVRYSLATLKMELIDRKGKYGKMKGLEDALESSKDVSGVDPAKEGMGLIEDELRKLRELHGEVSDD